MDKRHEGVKLSVEDQGKIDAPSLREVMAAIDNLTPYGGPGFLILDGPGESYLQAAGGDGAYVVERRVCGDASFRHFIPGRREDPGAEWISVPTNGYSVMAHPNEELRLLEVKAIAEAYIEGGSQAAGFVGRDMSDDFS